MAEYEQVGSVAAPLGPERRRRRSTWIVVSSLIVVMALAGALIWSLLRVQRLDSVITRDAATMRSQTSVISGFRSTDVMRARALQAANQYAVWLSSYNYKDLTSPASDWSQVEAHSTPRFLAQFRQTSAGLTPELTQYQAVATGTVIDAGISNLTDSLATLDILVDQVVTNASHSGPVTQPLRIELTLAYQNGQWLIDNLVTPK